jgi:hypothetical protein
MWELSISIKAGRSTHLYKGGVFMSTDFSNRIQAISTAYSWQLEAQKAFIAKWMKLSNEIIIPTLQIARDNFNGYDSSLKIEGGSGGKVSLAIEIIPFPKVPKKLFYSPKAQEGMITMVSCPENRKEPIDFPLDQISIDLIEGHVESFLKEALGIKP